MSADEAAETPAIRPPVIRPPVIRPTVIRLGNEFSEVVVELVRTRNGARIRISVPSSGREISLCPLELESLTWQDPEFFARLLATPHGPESG